MYVACMVDNEVQLQCFKHKMTKNKYPMSRRATVEGIMTQERVVSRSIVWGSGIRRRTVQRETSGTENGSDPVKIRPQVGQRACRAGHGTPGEDLSTGAG